MKHMQEFELRKREDLRVLLTAAEAFPALERAFLGARQEIWASFRIFDLDTKLVTPEARRFGTTWFDLVLHVLRRGVRIRIVIADFDPIARPRLHALTWRSVRMLLAAADLAGDRADLDVVPAMHAARTGIVPRVVLWPAIVHKLWSSCRRLNAMSPAGRDAALRDAPGLATSLVRSGNGRVRPRYLSLPELFPATHHQKLAVFDRRRLYIGGLDLNDRRFDTPDHGRPGAETWQDVQVLVDGPAADEAQRHLQSFLAVVSGTRAPPPQRRLLRTISTRRSFDAFSVGPGTRTAEIASAIELLSKRAEKLVYLETQFFRDRRLARALAEAARRNPELGLILILPAAPEEVAFDASRDMDSRFGEFLQSRCLSILRKAFRERLFLGTAAQPRRPEGAASGSARDRVRGAEIVYIHSKVSIFDDSGAVVSSANLNGRSLRWDTEAGLFLTNARNDVAKLRRRVFAHWLPPGAGEEYFDRETAVRAWRRLAIRNAQRTPEEREGYILPYDPKSAEAFGMSLPGIPDEMV